VTKRFGGETVTRKRGKAASRVGEAKTDISRETTRTPKMNQCSGGTSFSERDYLTGNKRVGWGKKCGNRTTAGR